MAAMMLTIKNFNNGCVHLKFISINIIAAISWQPPLISQLFHPGFFKAAPFFHSLAVFVWIKTHGRCVVRPKKPVRHTVSILTGRKCDFHTFVAP